MQTFIHYWKTTLSCVCVSIAPYNIFISKAKSSERASKGSDSEQEQAKNDPS